MHELEKLFDLQSLKSKRLLITGASAGIGWETARLLAPLVGETLLVARRADRLEELRRKIGQTVDVQVSSGDLTQIRFIDELTERGFFTDVDLLVNNAGLAAGLDPTVSANEDDWERMIELNIKAAFRVIRRCLPDMIKRQGGHIVNLSSVASHATYAQGGVYCATKHALLAFAKALRSEVCQHNIRVSNISPGMTETEFSLVRFNGDAKKASAVYAGMLPLTGLDIARQILFALLQPSHVNIDEIYLTPLAQGEVSKVIRR